MSHLDPGSTVRVAIAFAALKHKPRDQSTASYLLDLQSCFPLANKDKDTRGWRTYALELERQLATLKAQRDTDQELLSKLRTDVSQAASSSEAPPPKKKSKKNPTKVQRDLEWSWEQNRADWSRVLSSQYPSSPSLITAYASLKGVLASPDADLPSYASRLTDAIIRALETIHVFLLSAPDASSDRQIQSVLGTPLQLKSEHIDSTRIALVSPLLAYVLRAALHTLVCVVQDSTKLKRQRRRPQTTIPASTDVYACVDKVLDHLLECVLLVLLRAITPLCSARLVPLVSMPPRKDKNRAGRSSVGKGKDKDKRGTVDPPKTTDVRTDVFALIGTSLEALNTLPPTVRPLDGGSSIVSGIKDRFGLETIRELEALYTVPIPATSGSCPLPSQEPPFTPSEPPVLTPTPTPTPAPPLPTPTPTPHSAPSQAQTQARIQIHSQLESQPRTQQRAALELRSKWLEKLAGMRAERVRALATRDAGWFLASTLNLCVTPVLPAGTQDRAGETGGTLLRQALLDRIGKLVRSVPLGARVSGTHPGQQELHGSDALDIGDHPNRNTADPKFAIDPVCQNMLLAICERAISQHASP